MNVVAFPKSPKTSLYRCAACDDSGCRNCVAANDDRPFASQSRVMQKVRLEQKLKESLDKINIGSGEDHYVTIYA